MPLVEVKDLSVAFGLRSAVEGISFTIEAGERLGLIGESGSGKTLTALALAGLLPDSASTSGDILISGNPLPSTEAELARLRGKRIGFVFQEPMTALNPLMHTGDQIGEAVALHFPNKDRDETVTQLLIEAGLEPAHAERYPHQLSGGQRQRAMIAMALAGEPDLLICDEPTSSLDIISERLILDLLKRISLVRKTALLFISHDLRAIAALCTRVGVLDGGRLVELGTQWNILHQPSSAEAKKLVAAASGHIKPPRQLTTPYRLLRTHKLTRTYSSPFRWLGGRSQSVTALKDVSIDIFAAEALAVVGPSGCGKTTLAKLIAGLDRPTSGTISVGDQSFGANHKIPKSLRREISLVYQDPHASFDPRISVGQSVGEPLNLLPELTTAQKSARVVSSVRAVGLDPDILTRYPHQFSGGQRQRLAIARALVTRPKLVILDEPVSALDMSLRQTVLELLNHLRAELGLTYLIISHDLEMVRNVADRVIVLDDGQIVEQGTTAGVFANPAAELTKSLLEASRYLEISNAGT